MVDREGISTSIRFQDRRSATSQEDLIKVAEFSMTYQRQQHENLMPFHLAFLEAGISWETHS